MFKNKYFISDKELNIYTKDFWPKVLGAEIMVTVRVQAWDSWIVSWAQCRYYANHFWNTRSHNGSSMAKPLLGRMGFLELGLSAMPLLREPFLEHALAQWEFYGIPAPWSIGFSRTLIGWCQLHCSFAHVRRGTNTRRYACLSGLVADVEDPRIVLLVDILSNTYFYFKNIIILYLDIYTKIVCAVIEWEHRVLRLLTWLLARLNLDPSTIREQRKRAFRGWSCGTRVYSHFPSSWDGHIWSCIDSANRVSKWQAPFRPPPACLPLFYNK